MPSEVEGDALELAIKAAQDAHVDGRGPGEVAEAALAVAAPSIRSQERKRVREALKEQAEEYRREAREADGDDEDRLFVAAGVVDCVTEIISSPGAALDSHSPMEPEGNSGQDWMQTSLATVLRHFESEAAAADELALDLQLDDPLRARYLTERDTYRYVLKQIRGASQPSSNTAAELNPCEARELFSLWLCHGMRPPEIHPSHPTYTGAQKLGQMGCRCDEDGSVGHMPVAGAGATEPEGEKK